jgi:nitroreductase
MNSRLNQWNLSSDDFPADGYASDQLEFLLRYAILAPSTHNTQPWLFRINAMDVEVYADRRRALAVIDPQGRELAMSCGAALMNLRVAAEYFGHAYKAEMLPDARHPDLQARFQLGLAGETSGEDIVLFHAITQRRTNRQPFLDKPVPEEVLGECEAAARTHGAWFQVVRDPAAREAVADLVAEGDRRQWADKHFRAELSQWIRSKPDESGDGLPASIAGVRNWLSFAGPALIRTFDRGEGVAATDRDIALHSPVLAVLGTDSDDALIWLNAGQALQRVLLTARAEDISASFLNQPIEIPDLRGRLAERLGTGGYPQILLRLGYGPEIAPTPRRSLRQVLLMQKTSHP